MNIIELLQKNGIKIDKVSREVNINCMFCGDMRKHLYINTEKQIFFCHKCGASGNIWKLMKHFGMEIKPLLPHKKTKKVIKDKKYDELYIDSTDKDALKFLMCERGFTPETIKHFRLGIQDKYIAIPYFELNNLVNIKYRHIESKTFKREEGYESSLFNIDRINKSKDVIITEGEFDCISAYQLGFQNTISLINGAMSFNPEWIDYFDSISGNIYLALDNDPKGEEGALKIAQKIGLERCYRITLPHKDFNECLMSGIKKEEIDNIITKSIQYKPKNLYNAAEIFSDVDDIYNKKDEITGLKTSWHKFNNHLAGLRPSEITVVTGDTGSGKTTFTLNLMYDLIKKDKRMLIISSEISAKRVLIKLITMYKEKLFVNLNKEEYLDAIKYFSNKYIFFVKVHGKIDINEIQSYISYCKRKYDIEYVMLDHLHFFLDLGRDNMVQEIERFMRNLTSLCKETEVHTFLIAHPAKLTNSTGKVYMNDLKGSSSVKQDSDNIITLCRDKEQEEIGNNIVLVEFHKIRDENGRTGMIKYNFNLNSLLYKEK